MMFSNNFPKCMGGLRFHQLARCFWPLTQNIQKKWWIWQMPPLLWKTKTPFFHLLFSLFAALSFFFQSSLESKLLTKSNKKRADGKKNAENFAFVFGTLSNWKWFGIILCFFFHLTLLFRHHLCVFHSFSTHFYIAQKWCT